MREWIEDNLGWILTIILFLIMLVIGYYIVCTISDNLDGVTNITQRLYN